MKAAKDAGEDDSYDPTREDNIQDNILGRNTDKVSTLGRAPQRPDRGTGQCFEVCGEFVLEGLLARELLWMERPPMASALASSKVCGRSRSGRAFGPTWIRWMVCVFTHSVHGSGMCPGKYGPRGEFFFFLIAGRKLPAK